PTGVGCAGAAPGPAVRAGTPAALRLRAGRARLDRGVAVGSRAVERPHRALPGPGALPWPPRGAGGPAARPPQLTHYVLDAYVWPLDGPNPGLAEALHMLPDPPI